MQLGSGGFSAGCFITSCISNGTSTPHLSSQLLQPVPTGCTYSLLSHQSSRASECATELPRGLAVCFSDVNRVAAEPLSCGRISRTDSTTPGRLCPHSDASVLGTHLQPPFAGNIPAERNGAAPLCWSCGRPSFRISRGIAPSPAPAPWGRGRTGPRGSHPRTRYGRSSGTEQADRSSGPALRPPAPPRRGPSHGAGRSGTAHTRTGRRGAERSAPMRRWRSAPAHWAPIRLLRLEERSRLRDPFGARAPPALPADWTWFPSLFFLPPVPADVTLFPVFSLGHASRDRFSSGAGGTPAANPGASGFPHSKSAGVTANRGAVPPPPSLTGVGGSQ